MIFGGVTARYSRTTRVAGGVGGCGAKGRRTGVEGDAKRLSTHRSYHVSRTHADLVVFMPAVNHVEGLICRWLLWTGINACSASHFVTANAHRPPSLPPSRPRRYSAPLHSLVLILFPTTPTFPNDR